jgi:pyruvate dehydrogenase E1 component alpha subunit
VPKLKTPLADPDAGPERPVDALDSADLLRVMGDGGELADRDSEIGLDDAALRELFRGLVLMRTYDERAVTLQRQGRIGTFPTSWGEEAPVVGSVLAARSDDWVFPTYRQSGAGLLRGMDPGLVLRQWRGDRRGNWNPHEHHVLPITHPVATHLPHAVGLAWAARRRGEDVATLAFIGDGGTSEGDFHEGMNLAGVWQTPTVVVCTNNQWAISTPLSRQTANPRLADKALGYGIPAVRVDGFDVLAVHLACERAFERARGGGGPTFIEAFCYRIAPHSTPDDPSLYRDETVTDGWRALEPVSRFRGWLERQGLYRDGDEETFRAQAKETIAASVASFEDEPPPLAALVSDVYATVPWTLAEQLAELQDARSRFGAES